MRSDTAARQAARKCSTQGKRLSLSGWAARSAVSNSAREDCQASFFRAFPAPKRSKANIPSR